MSSTEKPQAQLPTNAIQRHFSKLADGWFEYIVRVHPHHTDYGGVVWHGTYIAWMEGGPGREFAWMHVNFEANQ